MDFETTIEILDELKEDGVPKNVSKSIDEIILCLNDTSCDENLKVHKTLSILDEISNDVNIDTLVRTQILNLTSILEAMLS